MARSRGTLGALILVFSSVEGEYGGGGPAAAGRRVGCVVAKGLLAFLAASIGDIVRDAFEADFEDFPILKRLNIFSFTDRLD